MPNIKLTLEYLGTRYSGWQIQANGPSVQQHLLQAIEAVTGQRVWLRVAGRTDAGVHALGQVANFKTDSRVPPEKFAPALNHHLPDDICVRRSQHVPDLFDAKRDSRAKHYLYRVYNCAAPSALERDRAWQVKAELQLDAMRRAAGYLVGEHDFESFRSVHCDAAHAVRAIHAVEVESLPFGHPVAGSLVTLSVKGNAFCRHMVRIITGTLIEVGRGRYVPPQVEEILQARDRTRAGMTAPACGLYLIEVFY